MGEICLYIKLKWNMGGDIGQNVQIGSGKPHTDVDQIMHVLENLERIYLIEVMTGPTWETTWTKQNA